MAIPSRSILRKYKFNNTQVIYHVNNPYEKILDPFVTYGRFQTLEGIYLTMNEFDDPNCARQYLAITFTPLYEFNFIYNDLLRGNYRLINSYGVENTPSRIWPAFGHYGGGWEIILINQSIQQNELIIPDSIIDKFQRPYGGKKDRFCFNSARSDVFNTPNLSITPFVQNIFHLLIENKEVFKFNDTLKIKIIDDQGVIFSWESNNKHFSISCAYKIHNTFRFSVDLAFWGYVWRDNEQSNQRYILKNPRTITDSFYYQNVNDATIQSLANRIQGNSVEFERILQHLNVLYAKLVEMADNFQRPKIVQLPTRFQSINSCKKNYNDLDRSP